jgi:two-component system, NarL family, sensor histidine kinase UhpB
MRYNKLETTSLLIGGMLTNPQTPTKSDAPSRSHLQKLITDVIMETQEKQRRELGKELHDNVNQVLATAKMYLGMAESETERKEEFIRRGCSTLSYAIEEIRKLSKSLVTPALNLSLKEALEELAKQINFSGQISLHLHYKKSSRTKIEPYIEVMLYRIVQEQLNNILKYAKASEAVITLVINSNTILMSITDNGIGFDPSKKKNGIGLKNIKTRVQYYSGDVKIHASPGKGCAIEISVPIINKHTSE